MIACLSILDTSNNSVVHSKLNARPPAEDGWPGPGVFNGIV
jgi:hypothetical protein